MKILIATYTYPPDIGGMQSHVYELVNTISQDHEVEVIWFSEHGNGIINNPKNVKVHRVNLPRHRESVINSVSDELARAKHVSNIVSKYNPDIIHAHSLRIAYPISLLKITNPWLDFKFIVTNHSSGFLEEVYSENIINKLKLEVLGKIPNGFITPSTELKEATKSMTNKPVIMIPNGVDIEKFSSGEVNIDIPPKVKDKFVVLSTRRFVKKNGMEYLVKSIPQVNDDIYFIFAGDGDQRPNLENWVENNNLMHRVNFIGAIDNEELADYYRLADVSVLPSLKEAISISGLESMACGTPVIGTDVGGIPELIDDTENGLLVSAKSIEGIADAINYAHENPELIARMGKNARETIEEGYSWPKIGDETISFYETILGM